MINKNLKDVDEIESINDRIISYDNFSEENETIIKF